MAPLVVLVTLATERAGDEVALLAPERTSSGDDCGGSRMADPLHKQAVKSAVNIQ